jgi:hypothetical protein
LRWAFICPHHDLGGEHVDPTVCRGGDPGRGDSLEVPDGDEIDVVLPLVGGDQSSRRGFGSAAAQDEPIGDHVEQ